VLDYVYEQKLATRSSGKSSKDLVAITGAGESSNPD
jgi:hypothetical protein